MTNLQEVNAYSKIAAALIEPCLWTLNMPSRAISKMPDTIARNCVPTPVPKTHTCRHTLHTGTVQPLYK